MAAPVFGDLRHVTFVDAGRAAVLGRIADVGRIRSHIKSIEDEVSERYREIEELEAELASLERKNDAAQDEVENLEEQIAELLAVGRDDASSLMRHDPPYGTTCVPQVPDWWETVGGAV